MFINAYTRLIAFFEAFFAAADKRLRTRQAALATAPAGYRGVTFIEYALLAAIAVVIAALFRKQLVAIFNNVLGNIADGTDTARTQ